MEDDRTTSDVVRRWLDLPEAQAMIRPGHERAVAGELQRVIDDIDRDRWTREVAYRNTVLADVYAQQINADHGHLRELDDYKWGPGVVDILDAIVEEGMNRRLHEVEQGLQDNHTTEERIDLFIDAAVGLGVLHRGDDSQARDELETFIGELPLDPREGDVDQLPQALDQFIDRMQDAGYLDEITLRDEAIGEDVWERLRETVEGGLKTRYAAEISQGLREAQPPRVNVDREGPPNSNAWQYETPEDIAAMRISTLSSLTTHVQAFVHAVKDFVRGRELEAPTQEHGAER